MSASDRRAETVQAWLEAVDRHAPERGSGPWSEERLKRLHGLQMALDVIAHVQNVPLRLLRLDNLVELDKTFVRFVVKWEEHILRLFTEAYPDGSARVPRPLAATAAKALVDAMKKPEHLRTLRDWVFDLADPADRTVQPKRPVELPPHYVEWFLMLLPHVERDVWLTEMSNPLPAHNLARMVEHCSLYILMWAWREAESFKREATQLRDSAQPIDIDSFEVHRGALGLPHLGLCVLPAFTRSGHERAREVALIVGPFLSDSVVATQDDDWFVGPISRYLTRVERVRDVEGWDEVREKAPGSVELHDALESRACIDDYEAKRRALQSLESLQRLLESTLDPSLYRWENGRSGRPLSRANWETMAVLAAWYERWGHVAFQSRSDLAWVMNVSIDRHRIRMQVGAADGAERLHFFAYGQPDEPPAGEAVVVDLHPCLEEARAANEWRWIEGTSTFFARMRERQQAAWTSHVAAINHLLARHSRRDRPEGADNPDARQGVPPSCEEADHLLRGFGGRVCRYLLSLARAEIAEIYWLDYRSDPPRLRHVSSAERLIQHRAYRQTLLDRYEAMIWKRPEDAMSAELQDGVNLGVTSRFQLYKASATGRIQPAAAERKAQYASAEPPSAFVWPDYQVGATRESPDDLVDHPDRPPPLDVVSVPLLFNDRVVGVFGLAGIASKRHFDLRLYPALHLVAQVLAQAMYFHSQVWHMRQLNWLASHVPPQEWKRHEWENRFNPLERVARCLANVFLSPVAQVWLVEKQNERRYQLHGNTAPEIFDEDGEPPEHAPFMELGPPANGRTTDLARSFIAFAVDQWTGEGGSAVGDAVLLSTQHGQFVQCQYDGTGVPTQGYDLVGAERGDLILHRDFVEQTQGVGDLQRLRKGLFVDRQLVQTMAFALVRSARGRAEVVGVVALYARGRNGAQRHAPWPPGWRPVVAHVQTYLPYLLMQTETIANPLYDVQSYLLHEGRNELSAASEQASKLRRALHTLLAIDASAGEFRARPVLRQWRTVLAKGGTTPPATDLLRDIERMETNLSVAADTAGRLMSIERGENMAMLARLIERRADLAALGQKFDHGGRYHDMKWTPLRQSLQELFDAYSDDLDRKGIGRDLKTGLEAAELLVQPKLWRWMIGDLVHNLVKYASPNSAAWAELVSPSRKDEPFRLRLRNESSFDPAVDRPDRLVKHGVQGSAGLARAEQVIHRTNVSRVGGGIGLWGVNLLADSMHLRLDIQIHQRRNPKEANYFFDLVIPPELLRRSNKG